MIIKTLTLENFRVFSGRHDINLMPEVGSPIVLFGGLNGAGKTSILTAIRYALLGRMAFDEVTSQKGYIEHLSGLIHHSNHISDPLRASVEITFAYIREGKAVEYHITRTWSSGEADTLVVIENDVIRSELNYEQAQAFLLELVPSGVANLVFFDGEKIADLAEDNNGFALKDAVSKLLGLNIVQRLQEDLRIYLKRVGISSATTQLQTEFETLESEKLLYLQEARQLRNDADNHYNVITELSRQVNVAEQKLLSGGGAWANDREETKKEVDSLLISKQDSETELLKELDGCYPLSLAPNTLAMLSEHLKQESDYQSRQHFSVQFEQFLPQLQDALANSQLQSNATLAILQNEISTFTQSIKLPEVEFGISVQQSGLLHSQIESLSQQSSDKVNKLKVILTALEDTIDSAAVNIERAPEKEQLKIAFDELRALELTKKEAVKKYTDKLLNAKEKFIKAQQVAQRLLKLHTDMKRAFGDNDSAARAASVIELLNQLKEHLSQVRITQLESEFNTSYKKLARKDDLDIKASIDHNNFNVTLYNNNKRNIDRKSMSAGEKQIYAIAMLDALAKVAGKKLPIVVDTPLGRLDSKHRNKLIENYFPEASEQVIILSTDTEVDAGFFDVLAGKISQSYQITFDAKTQSSFIDKGYFWQSEDLPEVV
ncbi:DNA sulfur modification protein DndD [Shewanella pneumatophori]|uniref:DNA sulfur modification protein DndD n=1 Tax=Shewanella pneumatophori TaxID=314092 RepID=A0A9X1ZA12_9GAMM|nr:DNA sulfur modification protein DndD [Shewanella pneumatophori]MCL1137187.1 DNA sulfur modification protein DndD [Shewanella pneumatophori]